MSSHQRPVSDGRIWLGVVTLAVGETVSWGILFYSFGVLLPAMEAELHLSRTTLTAIFSGALLVGSIAAAPAGRWLDRWGARRVMTVGSIVAALLVWTWSQVHSATGFAAVWLALGLTHALVLYEAAFAAVTSWFDDVRKRSRALLVITLIAGFASTVFLPLTGHLLAVQGWRATVGLLAVLLAVITIPIHVLLPSARAVANQAHAAGSARRASPAAGFRWLIVAFAFQGLIYGAVVVHAVPLLAEAGRSTARAAALAGTFGIFQVAGRLLVTSWWERMRAGWRIPALIAAQSISVTALFFAHHDLAVWAFVICFGASNGLLTLARPLAVAEWSGASGFGAAAGRLAAWTQAARAVAPVLAGGLYGWQGSYVGVVVAMNVAGVAGIAAALRASRHQKHAA